MTCCTVIRRLVFVHNITLSLDEHSVSIARKREAGERSVSAAGHAWKVLFWGKQVCNFGVCKCSWLHEYHYLTGSDILTWCANGPVERTAESRSVLYLANVGSWRSCPSSQITYLLGLLRSRGSIAKRRLLDPSRAWTKPCLRNTRQTLHR